MSQMHALLEVMPVERVKLMLPDFSHRVKAAISGGSSDQVAGSVDPVAVQPSCSPSHQGTFLLHRERGASAGSAVLQVSRTWRLGCTSSVWKVLVQQFVHQILQHLFVFMVILPDRHRVFCNVSAQ